MNDRVCPKFEKAFNILGKRWTGLIIEILLKNPKRFNELHEMIPALSARMLTERLKELEKEGIITRVVTNHTPKIEYRITDKGKDLQIAVHEIHVWAQKWLNTDN